ncbi:MAG: hydroxymethylglutaryl-CoA synthase family protein [Myxococcales bacterium]|nr:MAG: hydroxymethylglutaryl-CoA synthase family protein [Myxococcales bacterium]
MPVGLEAISVYIPRYYLDTEDLARANGTDPLKYKVGIGVQQFSAPAPHEDSVTMAHEAALALIRNYGVDPDDIGMLIVGSETGVDAAKPIAAYVHGLLGLPSNCRTFDTKHACYSATAALKFARAWCGGASRGRKALVIASDIARYEIGSPGEPTQGAGAVALLVSDQPGLLIFDEFPEAFYTKEVMDFWRPHYRATALVQGELSIESYLTTLESTFLAYCGNSGLKWDDFDCMLFHVPFPKMASKAYKRLCEMEAGDGAGRSVDELLRQFDVRTRPYLTANSRTGNLYSGSLYLSLADLLETEGVRAIGRRVGLFSYGSGCCGEYFSGVVGPEAEACRGKIGLERALADRVALSHHDYLRFRKAAEEMACNDSFYQNLSCRKGHCPSCSAFLGIEDNRRLYCVPNQTETCLRLLQTPRTGRPYIVAAR